MNPVILVGVALAFWVASWTAAVLRWLDRSLEWPEGEPWTDI